MELGFPPNRSNGCRVIGTLSSENFEPDSYDDEYRNRALTMIKKARIAVPKIPELKTDANNSRKSFKHKRQLSIVRSILQLLAGRVTGK